MSRHMASRQYLAESKGTVMGFSGFFGCHMSRLRSSFNVSFPQLDSQDDAIKTLHYIQCFRNSSSPRPSSPRSRFRRSSLFFWILSEDLASPRTSAWGRHRSSGRLCRSSNHCYSGNVQIIGEASPRSPKGPTVGRRRLQEVTGAVRISPSEEAPVHD